MAGSALCKVRLRPGVPVVQGYNSFEVQGSEGRGKGYIHQRAEQENYTAGRAEERTQHRSSCRKSEGKDTAQA